MRQEIIAQKTEQRYHRALKLVEAGHVSVNGQAHTFYVRSATGNGYRYLAATPEAITGGIGMCNCRDFQDFARHHGIKCKHIQASEVYEKAEAIAVLWAEKHGITLSKLADRLLWDINKGMPEPAATKACILFQATMRLADQEGNNA